MFSNFLKAFALVLALTFVPALVGSNAVYAQSGEGKTRARQVEELASEGAKAYRDKRYRDAIEFFEKAYEIQPVPNLLYNIGRCYEKLEEYEKAIEYYEEFAVAPEVGSEARREALKRSESLREIADIKKSDSSGGQQADGGQQGGRGGEKGSESESTSNVPLIVTVSGAGLIAAGGVFGVLASSSANEIDTGADFQTRQDAQSRARTQALVADSLFVVGAVTAGIGVYLLLSKGGGDSETQTNALVMPYAHDSGAGVGVRLDF
jgi:hypothetical protein